MRAFCQTRADAERDKRKWRPKIDAGIFVEQVAAAKKIPDKNRTKRGVPMHLLLLLTCGEKKGCDRAMIENSARRRCCCCYAVGGGRREKCAGRYGGVRSDGGAGSEATTQCGERAGQLVRR
jgi:hypothetical protein